MSRTMTKPPEAKPQIVRCAVYTRKSTEDGLEQKFNSLDAQREAGEAYIKSQKHEGWVCLANQYDDGGFTGANMDRPALRRLIADIQAGKVDCVVVYKVDRLSRSLLDFSRIMESFDQRKVAFVSVTQAFNTGSSMGRLILNVLLSFVQFEREMISERTRDKIAAARRKGKWSGGMPVLGYTVESTKLILDKNEADRVREIFQMYLEQQSALTVAKELNDRGWRTKQWTTSKGIVRGGKLFTKDAVYNLLSKVSYIGKIQYKSEVHNGEHAAIIDEESFEKVQLLLERNGQGASNAIRNKHDALLRKILQCGSCNCGMSHSYSKRGSKLYRYYVCTQAQKRGWQECPAPSLPAKEIERFVINQIRSIGRDPTVIRDTLTQARSIATAQVDRLTSERNALQRSLRKVCAQLGKIAAGAEPGDPRLSDAQKSIREADSRMIEIDEELSIIAKDSIDEAEVAQVLADFNQLWESMQPGEQARAIELLIERVTFDGRAGKLSITYRPTGIKKLGLQLAAIKSEDAA